MNAKLAIAIGGAAILFLATPALAGQSPAPAEPAEMWMQLDQDAPVQSGARAGCQALNPSAA